MIFVVLEGIATLLDVLMGVGSVMSTEESYNAAAAALLACGHGSSMWALPRSGRGTSEVPEGCWGADADGLGFTL